MLHGNAVKRSANHELNRSGEVYGILFEGNHPPEEADIDAFVENPFCIIIKVPSSLDSRLYTASCLIMVHFFYEDLLSLEIVEIIAYGFFI
jgi:hypothetical protein